MDELEAQIRKNPKAARNADALRAALEAVEQLREAGFTAGEYELAPSFGGKTAHAPKCSLNDLRPVYSR